MYSSLKTDSEFLRNIIGLPKQPQFTNYVMALKMGNMVVQFFNSSFNTVISILFILLFASIIGYFIARFKFKGKSFIYMLFLAGLLVPIHGFLIPIFIQFRIFNLLDKRFTLILPYVAFGLPLAVFLMESFVKDIPIEVEEAAVIDGASISRRLYQIIMPMSWPVLSVILILSFLNLWNEFPFALILINRTYLKTIPIGLTSFRGQYMVAYSSLMAALVMASLPVITVYLIFSKKVIESVTIGALKG
jgi:raffinose/stachyose/melibiose transport system permease protein